MAKRLIPLLDRILVEKIIPPTKSVGGVLLPESAASKVRLQGRIWQCRQMIMCIQNIAPSQFAGLHAMFLDVSWVGIGVLHKQSELQTIGCFFFSEHNYVPLDRISTSISSHNFHHTCNARAMPPHYKRDSACTTAALSPGSAVFTCCHTHQ